LVRAAGTGAAAYGAATVDASEAPPDF